MKEMEDKWRFVPFTYCNFLFKINNNIYIYIKEIEIIIIFIGEIFALDFERNRNYSIYRFFFIRSFVLHTSKLFVFGSVRACKLN